MIAIEDILISDDVVERQFVCDLLKCKGACCVEGDGGAPLELEELEAIDKHFDVIAPYLQPSGLKAIEEQGRYLFEKDDEYTGYGTPLIGNTGACAYVTYSENGIATCGIEQAYNDGKTDFRKPVSCHLYPVRVKVYEEVTAVNYETWDICSDACKLGQTLSVPVYQFVKDGLVRRFGNEFYEALEQAVKFKNDNA